MSFKDHFSAQSSDYARYRPGYPPGLFSWLATLCAQRNLAWDCGCGSGQATIAIARHFAWVVATDPSPQQLAQAPACGNVEYRCARAEQSSLADASVDLIIAAQALHWFGLDCFYDEVRRVALPHAVCAALVYGLLRVTPAVDRVIDAFYHEILRDYWPSERRHIETGYADLTFPFPTVPVPPFSMTGKWSLDHLCGYLNTWSALEVMRQRTGCDPLPEVIVMLRRAWGDDARKPVRWPLTVRVGRIVA